MGRWVAALIASLLMLLVGPAASASGDAKVRFVHDDPRCRAGLELHATEGGINQRVGRGSGSAQIGSYEDVPAGEVEFEVREAGGGPSLATREQTSEPRALHGRRPARRASPVVLRDGRAEGGQSHLRVVHAAPELGRVDVRLGDAAGRERARHRATSPATRTSGRAPTPST